MMFRRLCLYVLVLPALSQLSQDLVFVGESETEAKDAETSVEPAADSVETTEVFVATREWQAVLPGQAIPRGLHVRIDMQTGEKVARLLAEEETEEQRKARILQSIRNIKDDLKDSPKVEGTGKTKWRTMEELKEELKAGEMKISEDYITMKELVARFEQEETEEVKVTCLEELEYHVHQYDNALDFVHLGGLVSTILPGLNSSSPVLRKAAAFLLGGAAQSHPEVQGAALAAGLLPLLLRLTQLDPEPGVRVKALYALGSMVRRSPPGQEELVRAGGLTVLAASLREGGPRLRLKALTLLHDLLEEDGEGAVGAGLRGAGLCAVWDQVVGVPRADRGAVREDHLATTGEEWPLRQEHDTVEKVLEALARVVGTCREELLGSPTLRGKLELLSSSYSVLRDREAGEGEGSYFSHLSSLLTTILATLHHQPRTEL